MIRKDLNVGLDFAAPIPMHTDYSSGNFKGFEVDLMTIIAVKLDVELFYEVSLWSDILQRLREGRLDVICSAVTVTDERRIILDFSEPYLSFRLCVVTRKEGTINSVDQLAGEKTGIRKATEAEKFIKGRVNESDVTYSETNEELYQLLNDRKIDLLIDDSPIAGAYVRSNKDLKVSLFLPATESEYAIAIKKGNVALKNSIDAILAELKATGIWQELYEKWFKDIML